MSKAAATQYLTMKRSAIALSSPGPLDRKYWDITKRLSKLNNQKTASKKAQTPQQIKAKQEWRKRNRAYEVEYLKTHPERQQRLWQIRRLQIMVGVTGLSRTKSTVKNKRLQEHLGCSKQEFQAYLEKQFLPDMRWELPLNWTLARSVPWAAFDLNDPVERKLACHYSYYRPIFKKETLPTGESRFGEGTQ